jgi:hypothetical protein
MSKLFCFFLLLPFFSEAQVGGRHIFSFLNAAPNSRSIAYGGSSMVTWANDINVGFQNPALLQPAMHKQASLNYIHFPAGISAGSAAFCWHHDSLGTFLFGLQYFDYGSFTGADETGQKTGSFKASDYNFQIGVSQKLGHWQGGMNAKFIYSTIESYHASGIAADLGFTYHYSDTSRFVASILIRNFGVELNTYDHKRETFPLQIQAGISKQLAHLPFRYFLIFNNLQQPDISYINYNAAGLQTDLTTGEPIIKKPGAGDKIMRHIVLGGEFLFSQSFNLRFGYNYQHRKEMALSGKGGLSGFSWGVGIRISRLQLSYGGATYIPGVYNSNFGLTTQLSDWKKKR